MTLLEILVSMAILAMVSTLIYVAFDGMQRARTGIARIGDRYHQGRQALARMSRELQSAFLSYHQPQLLLASVRNFMLVGTDSGTMDRIDKGRCRLLMLALEVEHLTANHTVDGAGSLGNQADDFDSGGGRAFETGENFIGLRL